MPTAAALRFAALCTLTVAFVWGVIWYPFRHLRDVGISPQMGSLLVYALVALGGAVMFRAVLRQHLRLNRQIVILIAAFGYTNFGYTKAMIDGEVMRALLLFYLTPLWTALCARFLLKEHLSGIGWGVVAVSLAGCVAILWDPAAWAAGAWMQQPYEWLALTSGMAFSFGQATSRGAVSLPPQVKSATIWIGTALIGLGTAASRGELGQVLQVGWLEAAIVVALAACLLATSVISQYALTILPANQHMTIMLSELVFAALSAYWIAGETMAPNEWLGGTLIVVAGLFSGRMIRRAPAAQATGATV